MNDNKIISKYYDGYEGEPEIKFIRVSSGGKKTILRIWDGFFDKIMVSIKPDTTGWTGLAYYYHLHEGWYEDSPWQIPNVNEAIGQFQRIDLSVLDQQTTNVFKDICKLLRDAQVSEETVLIAYE